MAQERSVITVLFELALFGGDPAGRYAGMRALEAPDDHDQIARYEARRA